MHLRMGLLPLVVVIGIGCGGLGSGSFDGTVDGHTLRVEDAVFVPLKVDQGAALGAIVMLVDVPDVCSLVQAHRTPKNATIVEFALVRRSETGNPEPADNGTYAVSKDFFAQALVGRSAGGVFAKLDTNCTNIAGGIAISGTVNIDSIELEAGGLLIGTFDAIFGTQADEASGTFNAKYCEAIAPSEISATCG